MNKREVVNRVRNITRAVALGLSESAMREYEDELFFDVLNAIATGGDLTEAREMARAAIQVRRLAPRRTA